MATGPFIWMRNGSFYVANGATPLAQNSLMFFEGPDGASLVRTMVDIRLYVLASGSGTGVELEWWQDVIANVGVWWNADAVIPANSPTPVTAPDVSPDWVLNNNLYPHVDIFDVATPSENVTWSNPSGTITSSGKRRAEAGLHNTLWLAWEVIDNSGVINNTVSGINYYLGANIWMSALYELHV